MVLEVVEDGGGRVPCRSAGMGEEGAQLGTNADEVVHVVATAVTFSSVTSRASILACKSVCIVGFNQKYMLMEKEEEWKKAWYLARQRQKRDLEGCLEVPAQGLRALLVSLHIFNF